ncbi:hypothetical protein HHJ78_02590 [Mobiluncus mulieris]|uniref:Holin n=1 Tax=Mobiluncus mulieris TaxID=2052 RepID=A0A7Y0Y3J0_9ACTO|nr:holin [Mobiluncus mulieris]NMW64443.1 hypothetical protein [Mobiluncus mulieris]
MGKHTSIYAGKLFWIGVGERAVKTFAQALVALIGTSAVAIHTLDWPVMLSTATTAALLSVLTSIATPETAQYSKSTQAKPNLATPEEQ